MDTNGVGGIAVGLVDEFKRVLPRQRKTQRENLALSLALYAAVSTGIWHSLNNPSPAEKRPEKQEFLVTTGVRSEKNQNVLEIQLRL